MNELAIPTSVAPTTLYPYWCGRILSSIILSGIFHWFHINVTVQLNLPLKLPWKPLPLCRCTLLGLQPLWDGPPLVATSCALVVACWWGRDWHASQPPSYCLYHSSLWGWDLLAFCTCSGVLTSMYIKCAILESEVATSFWAATCSLSFLFFAFSLSVFPLVSSLSPVGPLALSVDHFLLWYKVVKHQEILYVGPWLPNVKCLPHIVGPPVAVLGT